MLSSHFYTTGRINNQFVFSWYSCLKYHWNSCPTGFQQSHISTLFDRWRNRPTSPKRVCNATGRKRPLGCYWMLLDGMKEAHLIQLYQYCIYIYKSYIYIYICILYIHTFVYICIICIYVYYIYYIYNLHIYIYIYLYTVYKSYIYMYLIHTYICVYLYNMYICILYILYI